MVIDPQNDNRDTRFPSIYRSAVVGYSLFGFGAIMFLAFLASAYVIVTLRESHPIASISLSAVWVVGVPIYFLIEHVVIFRRFGVHEQYEQFKRVQDLAAKIWAGAIIVLAAYFAQTLPT